MQSFASDNNSGACPEIMTALARANEGHALGYGDDPWTSRASVLFKKEFGENAEVFFALNGTGSNVLALSLASGPGQAVLCSDCAHIHVDETGAAEASIGCKILPLSSKEGKILPDALEEALEAIGNVHVAQPSCLSISEPTEIGTLYCAKELRELTEIAHRAGIAVHLDGARIANAAVALGLPLGAFGAEAGVDILSFGGMKNGLAFGEAVVVLEPRLAKQAPYLRKARLQLASKMRYISAQYEVYLRDRLWFRNAASANAAAARLAAALEGESGIELAFPVQVNALFVRMAPRAVERLRENRPFYDWEGGLVRWMTSFDTSDEEVDAFAAEVREAVHQ